MFNQLYKKKPPINIPTGFTESWPVSTIITFYISSMCMFTMSGCIMLLEYIFTADFNLIVILEAFSVKVVLDKQVTNYLLTFNFNSLFFVKGRCLKPNEGKSVVAPSRGTIMK